MSGISKRISGSWVSGDYGIMKTDTDTITTPADIYANDTTATVGLKGNMSQAGTPTSTTPIQPQECGDLTGNLLDKNANIIWHNKVILNDSGNETSSNSSGYTNPFIEVESNTTYALDGELSQYGTGTAGGYRVYYYQDDTFISRSSVMNNYNKTFTTPQNCNKIALQCQIINDYPHLDTVMLNTGSTALPYEPYGYKIPISSANTTTPVYLGEVETTRKIGKLVLTGEEEASSITQTKDGNNYCIVYRYADIGMQDILDFDAQTRRCEYPKFVSTHFTMKSIEGKTLPNEYNDISAGEMGGNTWKSEESLPVTYNGYIIFCISGITTVADFKAYLAQQYANGTPVTVWYVLATETTGIVNEPIRKIGDYADTVSGITIPTIAGKDTFDVLTTLKPSEVSLAYTGWHDATVNEWDGSEWN